MVDRVYPQEDTLILEDIFGRRKIVKAKISELTLVDHKIILEIE
jgi:predicted RNA-binding protein